jgi:hypothetical protein
VTRFEGKPFVLLGVNADETKETVQKLQDKKTVTWRSWCDGRSGRIAREWGLQGFPTLCVLDHQGIIRYQYLGAPDDKELEKNIEALLKEAEASRTTS